MNKRLPIIRESAERLQNLISNTDNGLEIQRFRLLYLIKTYKVASRSEAAEILGMHRNWVGKWLGRYEKEGIEAFIKPSESGPREQRSLPQEVLEALVERLNDIKGYGSYTILQTWLVEEYGISIKYNTLRQIILRELSKRSGS